jgi:hypothetical protein
VRVGLFRLAAALRFRWNTLLSMQQRFVASPSRLRAIPERFSVPPVVSLSAAQLVGEPLRLSTP